MGSPVTVSREFAASPQRIWHALTDNDEIRQWFFDLPGFNPEIGDEFQFYGGDEKQYLHLCKIEDLIPEEKLSYSWRYNGFPGDSLVSFELLPAGENTRLTVTHTGLETFPSGNPDFASSNFEAGWTEIIGTSLKKHLEKQQSA